MVYLDYAASSVVDSRVVDAMLSVYRDHPGNANSRMHHYGEECRDLVEQSRQEISTILGANADEVVFTSGATESDNLAILGLLDHGISVGKRHIVSTSIEHKAVLASLRYAESLGFDIDLIDPDTSGSVSAESVVNAVRDDTLLVSVMHVNNETGAIQPIREIGDRLASLDSPPYFHVDAAQSAGKLIESVSETKYDLLSACGHKMYGPQGIGALVARRKGYVLPPLKALMHGGGQEGTLRSGTLPVALIVGFGEAARLCREESELDYAKAKRIKSSITALLNGSDVKYVLNGVGETLPNILNVRFPGVSSEALMIAGKPFYAISNGSACNSQSYSPSYVLQRMGLSKEEAMESVRVSWGRGSTEIEVLDAIQNMVEIVSAYQ